MTATIQFPAALLVLAGAFFCFVASVGVVRLEDLFMRMHAASKAGTFGAGLPLVAAAIALWDGSIAVRALATAGFLLFTAPVAAHVLCRAAYRRPEVELSSKTIIDELGRENVSDPEEPGP